MTSAPRVWYFVPEFDRGRDFYKRLLGFDETYVDWDDKWSKLEHGSMRIALSEGEPSEAGVAMVDVDDVIADADRLRAEGVEVGTVIELAGQMRIVDVFDPYGNRIQLAQHISSPMIRKGSPADVPFMRSMLTHAYAWRVNALDADISLTRYVDNWGRAGDVARDRPRDGQPGRRRVVQALPRRRAGLRLRRRADAGAVDLRGPVPPPARRGEGAARRAAREGEGGGPAAVSLSVEKDSPAVAFYERNGFEPVGRVGRRPRDEARALTLRAAQSRTCALRDEPGSRTASNRFRRSRTRFAT